MRGVFAGPLITNRPTEATIRMTVIPARTAEGAIFQKQKCRTAMEVIVIAHEKKSRQVNII